MIGLKPYSPEYAEAHNQLQLLVYILRQTWIRLRTQNTNGLHQGQQLCPDRPSLKQPPGINQ